MQLSAGVLQSIVLALFASQVSGSAIPNAEQLVLNCEKLEAQKTLNPLLLVEIDRIYHSLIVTMVNFR